MLDHAPTSMLLEPGLLTNPEIHQYVTEAIVDYFSLNSTDEMAPLTIWEERKCTLR